MSHLTQISFKNFRVFDNKTVFELAPITFLTGPNSSGKSSLLKALLLLKSNYSSDLQVLDFSGSKHNLGTFENTLNNESKDLKDCLIIGLQTKIGSLDTFASYQSTFIKQPVTTKRSVYSVLKEYDDSAKVTISIELTYQKNERSGKLIKIEIFAKEDDSPFFKLEIGNAEMESKHKLTLDAEKITKDKNLSAIFHGPLRLQNAEVLNNIKTKSYYLATNFSIKENAKESYIDEPITVFRKLYEKYIQDNFDLKNRKEIHPYFSSMPLKRILKDFAEISDNVEYLEAVRANTKRIYTNDSQGTSFNELILEYRSREISEVSLKFTNKWLKKFEIADEIRFENIEGVATSIFLIKNEKKIALADLGYGITQFLPILLKIALEEPINLISNDDLVIVKKIILLEEPETNLHPKLQSLIADFLFDAIKTFEIRFIIETHSEYIIRKMQILVAEKKIRPHETLIYYFNEKNNENSSKVIKIEIQQNGALSKEFGDGFYDEATNLKIELLKSKIQK
jgi:predicted ATPase